jgi:hypothetical protein
VTNDPILPFLYTFLDEGGNFNFTSTGTKYFTMTALTVSRPFPWDGPLLALKYDEIERFLERDCFHATEDKQAVRNKVFAIIADHLADLRVDAVIVEKSTIKPETQPIERFYPAVLGDLLRHVISTTDLRAYAELIVVTDALPVQKKRQAVEKAIKETLADALPQGVPYRTYHHESKAWMSLQVADYCNWAIYKKWDRGDGRSYNIIRSAIQSERMITSCRLALGA